MHRLIAVSHTAVIGNRLQPLERGRQTGKHWRTSLEGNMLRNKDIPDQSYNCKLRQTMGRWLQRGPQLCSSSSWRLPTARYCNYRWVQVTCIYNRRLPSCSCTFQVEQDRDRTYCESLSELVKQGLFPFSVIQGKMLQVEAWNEMVPHSGGGRSTCSQYASCCYNNE